MDANSLSDHPAGDGSDCDAECRHCDGRNREGLRRGTHGRRSPRLLNDRYEPNRFFPIFSVGCERQLERDQRAAETEAFARSCAQTAIEESILSAQKTQSVSINCILVLTLYFPNSVKLAVLGKNLLLGLFAHGSATVSVFLVLDKL